MPQMIDLRRYVTAKVGPWATVAERFAPSLLWLADPKDEVTLAGPLRVNVAVVAENRFQPFGGSGISAEGDELFSYDLEIPAGYTWTYHPTHLDPTMGLGTNAGWHVVIRPAKPVPQCAPVKPDCDVPCDFAVADCPDTGQFFPAGCEPCAPGVKVALPPTCSPTLAVPTATGGCVRPHYFNGMFITAEDLETHLRYDQVKRQLQNRAAGQGVVWGLNVGLDGGKVAVAPGYAVDCCGHDLAVVTCYRVDPRTLLCDPAATRVLGTPGPHRMHLLLEYVECLQDARPVHGDPCSTRVERCEMSRVRETARLRLVPPRDLDTSGPIADFLKEVEKIRGEIQFAGIIGGIRFPTAALAALPAQSSAPFLVKLSRPNGSSVQVRPNTTTPPPQQLPLINPAPQAGEGITLSIVLDPGWTFGDQVMTSPDAQAPLPAAGMLQVDIGLAVLGKAPNRTMKYQFDWKATAPAGDLELSGSTIISLHGQSDQLNGAVLAAAVGAASVVLQVSTTINVKRVELRPWPCIGGQCATGGEKLFPVMPPWWMHEHQRKPGKAADPQVLVLAAMYGVLIMRLARIPTKPPPNALETQAGLVLAKAAQELLGTDVTLNQVQINLLAEALQRLFQAWCCAFLYPGPHCEGEPHGVVIGCAIVNSGTIQNIDPWGGRRYVVHYPLLAHWGAQFGIAPLDVIMSRVASFICCIGGLPTTHAEPEKPPPVTIGTHVPAQPKFVPAGNAVLAVGDSTAVPAQVHQMGITVTEMRSAGLAEFVSRLLTSFGQEAPPQGAPFVQYTLEGAPDVSLLVPSGAPAVARPAVAVPGALRDMVHELHATGPARVQPLLRPVAEDLTSALLTEAPVATVLPDGSPLAQPLAVAGIGSVADVLTSDPEALHVQLADRATTPEIIGLLDTSDSTAGKVARAVGETLKTLGAARGVGVRSDLTSAEVRSDLSKTLSARLHTFEAPLPEDAVRRAVDRVLGAGDGGA